MNESSYDIIFGIDRSDASVQIELHNTKEFTSESHEVSSSPEKLHAYFKPWFDQADKLKMAVAFEQPAPNLMIFFSQFDNITIYPLNPVAPKKYRETFKAASCRTDETDAYYIADLVRVHSSKLKALGPINKEVAQLDALNEGRRKLVDRRTALTNQLQAALKKYFPQAIHMLSDDLWRPMDCAFLLKWPSLQALKKSRSQTIINFFHKHGSRSQKRMNTRLAVMETAVPLTNDTILTQALVMEVTAIVRQIETIVASIKEYDFAIADLYAKQDNAEIFSSMPGAGLSFAPRLLCAFDLFPQLWTSPDQIQRFSGIAPITIQSGKMKRVHKRLACPNFLRQTFHEWAKESCKHSAWANAYYHYNKNKGKHFNTIIRSLAYKWIRILFICWKNNEPYNEKKYIQSLLKYRSPICSYIPHNLLKTC